MRALSISLILRVGLPENFAYPRSFAAENAFGERHLDVIELHQLVDVGRTRPGAIRQGSVNDGRQALPVASRRSVVAFERMQGTRHKTLEQWQPKQLAPGCALRSYGLCGSSPLLALPCLFRQAPSPILITAMMPFRYRAAAAAHRENVPSRSSLLRPWVVQTRRD